MIPFRLPPLENDAGGRGLARNIAGNVSVPSVCATNPVDVTGVLVFGARKVSATAQPVKKGELHR